VNESNYSTDASLSYLIPNTEFKMEAQLSGFQIGAKRNGRINITVCLFFWDNILKLKVVEDKN
jgi:hypothetical protein